MARSDSHQIADAKAEAYWSSVERRNTRRRAAYAEMKQRPICCQCKAAPMMKGMDAGGHCTTCDIEIRRCFSPEEYQQTYGRR